MLVALWNALPPDRTTPAPRRQIPGPVRCGCRSASSVGRCRGSAARPSQDQDHSRGPAVSRQGQGNTPLRIPQNTSTHSCVCRIPYKVGKIPRREYPKSHHTQRLWVQPQQRHRQLQQRERAELPQHPISNRPSLMRLQQAAPGHQVK
jgi:hypothetical protein